MMARASAGWFKTLEPGGLPVAAGMSADYPTGLTLMLGILIALMALDKTGQGQRVTTDLFSVALHAHIWESAAILNRDRIDDGAGIGVTEQAIQKAFRTSDGLIELSAVFSPDALRDISVAMGLGDLTEDSRFDTVQNRLANRDELNAILAERFLENTTQEWVLALERQGVLSCEIRTFEEAVDDPQVHANNMVIEMEHPRAGHLRLLGTPLRMSDTPASHRLPPDDLGGSTSAVLRELGYDAAAIAKLREEGAVG